MKCAPKLLLCENKAVWLAGNHEKYISVSVGIKYNTRIESNVSLRKINIFYYYHIKNYYILSQYL